jgi:hypothetical protein
MNLQEKRHRTDANKNILVVSSRVRLQITNIVFLERLG